MGRIIGIRHRIKFDKEGNARPTELCFAIADQKVQKYKLEDETAELDWVLGKYPTKYRKPEDGEDLSQFAEHQIKRKKDQTVTKVPAEFDGLQPGDTVVMVLGGSGDYLAYAISVQADKIGAKICRVPPFTLKQFRGEDKTDDAQHLVNLYMSSPEVFQEVSPRDREFMLLGVHFRGWKDAQKSRIACEQRIGQAVIGESFCCADGLFPQGSIKKAAEEAKANDQILKNMEAEEARRLKAMAKHVETMDIFQQLFAPIKGCGPRISARLLVAIGDIRRFETTCRSDGKMSHGSAKLKSYLGVSVNPDGTFRRKRKGQVANWHNEGRLALYLVVDQFIKNPNSEWGQRFRQIKEEMRNKHPETLCKTCSTPEKPVRWEDCQKKGHKRMYNDGHIHNMAIWRTATKFVEHLWKEWTKLENKLAQKEGIIPELPVSPQSKGEAKQPSSQTGLM